MTQRRVACLVCGYRTLSQRGSFEVCPVCFWEDEGEIDDHSKPTYGPNGSLSLDQARKNYEAFGAVLQQFVDRVRHATSEERQ